MRQMLNFLFTEEETLKPRFGVGAGLGAFALVYLAPFAGLAVKIVLLAVAVVALGLVSYAALRLLVPMMDPRDPDADRFAVWGGLLLFAVAGMACFGLVFVPGFALGAVLLWLRVPELLEVLPVPVGKDAAR